MLKFRQVGLCYSAQEDVEKILGGKWIHRNYGSLDFKIIDNNLENYLQPHDINTLPYFMFSTLRYQSFFKYQVSTSFVIIRIQPESVSLCRNGIPNSLRSTVWNLLIHQTVADLKVHYGKYYYRNLCNTQEGEEDNAVICLFFPGITYE